MVWVCVCVCVCVCARACVHTCMHACVCMHTCLCVWSDMLFADVTDWLEINIWSYNVNGSDSDFETWITSHAPLHWITCVSLWPCLSTPLLSTDQDERVRSVEQFKNAEKDVLVATDVASKGLDFPDIQHVINYDMPEDIENYGKWRGLCDQTCTISKPSHSSSRTVWRNSKLEHRGVLLLFLSTQSQFIEKGSKRTWNSVCSVVLLLFLFTCDVFKL